MFLKQYKTKLRVIKGAVLGIILFATRIKKIASLQYFLINLKNSLHTNKVNSEAFDIIKKIKNEENQNND